MAGYFQAPKTSRPYSMQRKRTDFFEVLRIRAKRMHDLMCTVNRLDMISIPCCGALFFPNIAFDRGAIIRFVAPYSGSRRVDVFSELHRCLSKTEGDVLVRYRRDDVQFELVLDEILFTECLGLMSFLIDCSYERSLSIDLVDSKIQACIDRRVAYLDVPF
jgi:hypothetical protein